MVRYRFGRDDLLRTRFAIAPLIELLGASYVAQEPPRRGVHAPWAEWAAPRVAQLDLALLKVAAPFDSSFFPMFTSPPPRAPHAEIEHELERVAATAPDVVAAEIARAHPDGVPAAGRVLVDDPARGLRALVEQMHALWKVAVAPWWGRIVALLESEIARRARRLAAVGAGAAFSGLHETVTWDDGVLSINPTGNTPADVDLAGRGLLLVPVAFTWPLVWPRCDARWDPALVYPPPGVADLWAPEADHEALAALLGRRRARILHELDRPASTLELARRLGVSPGGVSEHLTVLRRAGLVAGWREGRSVIYARTELGDSLCS